MNEIFITKANGEKEIFDIEKLKNSLRRAGASEPIVEDVSKKVAEVLFDGVSTHEIYQKAFELLREKEKYTATKYSLRRAITELGPQGFPFEDFIGEIFRAKKYKVEVGKIINGLCVLHELDVVAIKDDEFIGVEVKFHTSTGVKSDLKTVLYVKARFDDLMKGKYYRDVVMARKQRRLIVTNTKFTSRAVQYGECAGIELIGWNYPRKGNLQDLIDETHLHPITALQSLTKNEKKELLNQGIVLCRDISIGKYALLKPFGISENRISEVLKEVEELCKL
jgi:hypothetical protein